MKLKKMFLMLCVMVSVMAMSVVSAFATGATPRTPESLLNDETMQYVHNFAQDVVPTVLALIGAVIGASLTLWGISFGVRKGIGFIKRHARI